MWLSLSRQIISTRRLCSNKSSFQIDALGTASDWRIFTEISLADINLKTLLSACETCMCSYGHLTHCKLKEECDNTIPKCSWSSWGSWGPCFGPCGVNGIQWSFRSPAVPSGRFSYWCFSPSFWLARMQWTVIWLVSINMKPYSSLWFVREMPRSVKEKS